MSKVPSITALIRRLRCSLATLGDPNSRRSFDLILDAAIDQAKQGGKGACCELLIGLRQRLADRRQNASEASRLAEQALAAAELAVQQ